MAGTLPKTKLLIVEGVEVRGEFNSWGEAAKAVGLEINRKGHVWLRSRSQQISMTPSYAMATDEETTPGNGWEPDAALADWMKCYHHQLPPRFKVYRFLVNP